MKKILSLTLALATLSIGRIGAQNQTAASGQTQLWGLEQCMQYAVEKSPTAIRQQLATANLKLDYGQAIMSQLPSLSGSVGATASYGRNINPADNTYTNTSTFQNTYGLNAGLTVFNGLQLLNQTRIARISKLRGLQNQQQVEDQIAINTMQAYFDLSYVMGTVTLSRERLETSRVNLLLGQRMLEIGMKDLSDVAQLEADLAEQEYNLLKTENDLRTKELKLKEVMNFPLEGELVIDTVSRYGTPIPETTQLSELVQYATEAMPGAQMSKMDVRISKLRFSTNKWRLLPTLSVSGGIGTNYNAKIVGGDGGEHFGDQFKDHYSKSFGGTLSIPIFQGWSRTSDLLRSRNNLRSVEQDRIQNIREIAVEVEQAVLDLNGALSEREQAARRVKASELAYKAAQRKYTEGMISVIDLQTTSNQLLSAKATLLNSELTWQAKRKLVDYYKGIPLLEY